MNARSFSKALRSPLARQFTSSPAVQRRTIFSALNAAARPTIARAVAAGPAQQTRGVKTVDFAGHKETVFGKLQCVSAAELKLMSVM
jgi:ketol-acid reductoisomerase